MAKLSIDQAQEAIDAFYRYNKIKQAAANALGLNYSTYENRLKCAFRYKLSSQYKTKDHAFSETEIRRMKLEAEVIELRSLNKELLEKEYDITKVKEIIYECKQKKINPPKWLMPKSLGKNTGVPTLFCSDWHWDEVIQPSQINGVNAFNRQIAERRAKQLFLKTADLLINHMAKPQYDYLNLDFGGDMLSGNIHEELRETNECPISQSIISVLDSLISGIDFLLPYFLKIKVDAVPGNHGRWDRKPRFKHRVFENFEWLLYQFLARHYKGDDRLYFNISDGADLYYQIYNTRYLLTHGDQFRGGSGIAGALSPLMLGDARKRKRSIATDQPYDFMLMGHWHQLMFMKGIIVNGSLKGLDEYAFQQNFEFELPQQALWITHPIWGITARWPVYLEKPGTRW